MIVLDEITGLLTITDTPKNHELARKLIKEWDIGPKEVQIEAKFIEITFTDLDEMGLDWRAITEEQHSIFDFNTGMMGDASATTAATFKQAAEAAGLGFFAGKASVSGAQLLAYLKALQQSGKANLLHAPIVTTLSGQRANIQVVRSFPYATSATRDYPTSGGDTYTVETYEMAEEVTGITLEVTPTVVGDSDVITLEIHPEVSRLNSQVDITATAPDNLGWPIVDTRTAQTTVMVRSGETIILGGLIQDKDDDTIERKIPILGDAPLVGPLFRYKYEKREKKNLVVFLTARLIDMQGKGIQ
jgi:type II secretory pathway component GspD/PulD (secretin)